MYYILGHCQSIFGPLFPVILRTPPLQTAGSNQEAGFTALINLIKQTAERVAQASLFFVESQPNRGMRNIDRAQLWVSKKEGWSGLRGNHGEESGGPPFAAGALPGPRFIHLFVVFNPNVGNRFCRTTPPSFLE